MPGLNKDRHRPITLGIRVSPEELRLIRVLAILSGLPVMQFYRAALTECEVNITVGKYQSDRLGVELARLRVQMQSLSERNNPDEMTELLLDIKVLLSELLALVKKGGEENEMKKTIIPEKE